MTHPVSDERLARQIALEDESVGLGIDHYERFHSEVSEGKTDEVVLSPGQGVLYEVTFQLAGAIEEWVHKSPAGRSRHNAPLTRFLAQMNIETCAFLTARTCLDALSRRSTLQHTAIRLYSLIKNELDYQWSRTGTKKPVQLTGISEIVRLGLHLIGMFIETTELVKLVRQTHGQHDTPIFLEPTRKLSKLLKKNQVGCELLYPHYLPMIVPPKPWTTPTDGGYSGRRLGRLSLVKTHSAHYLEVLAHAEMPAVYRAVNGLQNTSWRINRRVYEVLREVWDGGGSLGKLPSRESLPLPPRPFDFRKVPKEHMDAEQQAQWKEWKGSAGRIHETNARLKSKRFAVRQKLAIAERFLDEPEIFFPHSLDYRGRAYPVPAYVNPQGDDSGKALLEFTAGKPLGEKGARWLALHLAGVFGKDKGSFNDRIRWVNDHEKLIVDSAVDPLGGGRFWTEAGKPYCALAACFEWAGYLEKGVNFVSHIPIAQDGSCNGIQHYSACLRDSRGGASVNLTYSPVPQDLYSAVSKAVAVQVVADCAQIAITREEIEKQLQAARDTLSGFPPEEREKGKKSEEVKAAQEHVMGLSRQLSAMSWNGNITRKIVKRNVMTLPYGSREYGMRLQLVEELMKLDDKGECPIGSYDKYDAALYLAPIIYETTRSEVVAAKDAMDWLQGVASIVARAGLPLRWITPSGLPVFQEYRVQEVQRIRCRIGDADIRVSINVPTRKIDVRKQADCIAPNFVHSLDAAHMIGTVNLCLDAGISSFAMVHDSYATHAADSDTLADLLREAFITQYSKDVLEDFRQQVVDQLSEEFTRKIKPVPPKGDLDLKEVRKSLYFFA